MRLVNIMSKPDGCNGVVFHIFAFIALSDISPVMGRLVAYHQARDLSVWSVDIIKKNKAAL